MEEEPDYEAIARKLGLQDGIPRVLEASRRSADRLRTARAALADLHQDARTLGATILTYGSVARREATDASDLDLATIALAPLDSDERRRGTEELNRRAGDLLRRAGFDVADKTFKDPVRLDDLVHNIGGPRESNRNLTYRALTLTESAWLLDAASAARVREAIFAAYSGARTARGIHLASLFNDLHRYYRTICLDYRWKVEEEAKPWAVRNAKLRCSRKLWHLANIATYCVATSLDPGDDHDAFVSAALREPPLLRIATMLDRVGQLEVARDVLVAFDAFLDQVGNPAVRGVLEALAWESRDASAEYQAMKGVADRTQRAAAAIFDALAGNPMFRDHLLRFVVL